jgi:hypothetical protein
MIAKAMRSAMPSCAPRTTRRRWLAIAATLTLLAATLTLLAGCEKPGPAPRTPDQVRARVAQLLPPKLADRAGWARDVQAAFTALKIDPSDHNLCAALAVAEQESGFRADPPVPGLGRIAIAEIERRAARHHLPNFLVHAALSIDSPDGRSYEERLAAARTERELSELFEQMIATVPLGRRLFAESNPVHTGGPMQVSVGFAEAHAAGLPYPYRDDGQDIRHEVFTRRGGLYFGIAHLLGYPASYNKMLFRFADYNAGFYASRNAAFQYAASKATGMPLVLDGDLVRYGKRGPADATGATEIAVQALSTQLGMDDRQIHRALLDGERVQFEHGDLYRGVYEIAERAVRGPLARARVPQIALDSPKITRKLTTAWFAERVNARYLACLAR